MSPRIADQHEYQDEDFHELDLQGATLEAGKFHDCRFTRCNFSETVLQRCRFNDCEFIDCNLSLAKLTGSGFTNVTFTGCKLVGIDWAAAYWSAVRMPGALSFDRCVLNDCSFFGLDLRELKLIDSRAFDADFTDAHCEDADFQRTDFRDALFRKTRLARANFSEAQNYRIDIFNNDIKGARFSLPEAIALLDSLDIELAE